MAKIAGAALAFNTNTGKEVRLDYPGLRKGMLALRAVAHPVRKKMIALLDDKKQLTVTDIYVKLRLEQSVASQHLAVLRRAKVLDCTRKGKFIYYGLNTDMAEHINKLVDQIAQ